MFFTNCMEGAQDGVLDVIQQRIEPLEGRVLCSLTTIAGEQAYMQALGSAYTIKAIQPSETTSLPDRRLAWA
jgi:hypothetical protein